MATATLQGVGNNDFLQLFITQLRNQDPTSPLDSNGLTNQLAQLSTFESLQNLSASFDQMLQLQQLTQGSDLIGRTIRYTAADGSEKNGIVGSVSVNNGNVFLNVGSATVALDNVLNVTQTST